MIMMNCDVLQSATTACGRKRDGIAMRRGDKYRCTFWYNGSIRKLTRGFLNYEHAYQWLRQKGYSAIDVEKIGGDEMAKVARLRSDYSPKTVLTMVLTDDGDVCIRIFGDGEMRIATSGSQLKGEDHIRVLDALKTLIDAVEFAEKG